MTSDDSTPPWATDRGELDAARVRAAVEAEFPTLAPATPHFLARGWDHDAWRVGDWVFRFPRRASVAQDLGRHRALLERIAGRLPVPVPRIGLVGRAGPHFPHPFAAHRFLPGVPADEVALQDGDEEPLARALGPALAALHGIDASDLALDAEDDRNAERRARVMLFANAFRAAMPAGCAERWAPILDGRLAVPRRWSGPPRVTHNDLNAEHLLLDPVTRRLTGIFDWNDAALGDPAVDFVGLWIWRGETLVRRTLAHYDAPWDEAFVARIAFEARCLVPLWIAECQHYGDADELARLRAWFIETWEPRELARAGPQSIFLP